MGRFISEDPMGFSSGTINFYNYVSNNPINFIDPLGLFGFDNTWLANCFKEAGRQLTKVITVITVSGLDIGHRQDKIVLYG